MTETLSLSSGRIVPAAGRHLQNNAGYSSQNTLSRADNPRREATGPFTETIF